MQKDEISRRALEVLKDPQAKEPEWMAALQVLGSNVPARKAYKLRRSFERYCYRFAGLSVVYFVLFSGLVLLNPYYASTGLITAATFAVFWAFAEINMGLFTLAAVVEFSTHLHKLASLDPSYHLSWIVIALNVFIYTRGKWMPYLLTIPCIGRDTKRLSCDSIPSITER